MTEGLAKGDFYILCPDNDVDRATDKKRIAWAAAVALAPGQCMPRSYWSGCSNPAQRMKTA
jgi:hypothetical protein